jgi:uncharacterized protein (UPF0179 family)
MTMMAVDVAEVAIVMIVPTRTVVPGVGVTVDYP